MDTRNLMIEISVSSIRSQLFSCPDIIAKSINELCSYRAYNYQFMDAYINGLWDGYVRKFSLKTHTFPSGLVYRIAHFLRKHGIDYTIKDTRAPLIWNNKDVTKNLSDFKFTLRPYQVDGLVKGLRVPYMVYWWATSSGKTVLFSALISALKKEDYRHTLILVTTKDLAAQHREEIGEMLDEKIGLIEEGRFEPERITVAVINTLWNNLNKKKSSSVTKKYLKQIDHLIVDEVHHLIDSKMMKSVVNKCSDTVARHGFSGSPYSLTTDDLELECLTGPPLSKVTLSDLIIQGYVSRPDVIIIDYDSSWTSAYPFSKAYDQKIVNGEERNSIVVDTAIREFSRNNSPSVLILVRIIKHGKILHDKIVQEGVSPYDVEFIHGSTPMVRRHKVKNSFKNKELNLVIASQIWNEGIDIPSMDVLIKADGGGGKEVKDTKGVRSVIQQIGRVVRKPIPKGEEDVNVLKESNVKVFDFYDNVNKDLRRHSDNRIETYKLEKEFHMKRIRR